MTPEERALKIENEARGLVAWCNEFVSSVKDHSGNELGPYGSGEWAEVLSDLEVALKPIEPDPAELREPPCDLCVPDEVGTCINCGWTD